MEKSQIRIPRSDKSELAMTDFNRQGENNSRIKKNASGVIKG